MKNDINGCSTCSIGQENYEYFTDYRDREFVQYDYRTNSGKLFSCVATSLEIAREKLDKWLKNQN